MSALKNNLRSLESSLKKMAIPHQVELVASLTGGSQLLVISIPQQNVLDVTGLVLNSKVILSATVNMEPTKVVIFFESEETLKPAVAIAKDLSNFSPMMTAIQSIAKADASKAQTLAEVIPTLPTALVNEVKAAQKVSKKAKAKKAKKAKKEAAPKTLPVSEDTVTNVAKMSVEPAYQLKMAQAGQAKFHVITESITKDGHILRTMNCGAHLPEGATLNSLGLIIPEQITCKFCMKKYPELFAGKALTPANAKKLIKEVVAAQKGAADAKQA